MLSLKFLKRNPNRPFRVGVVIGRKVSKSAVVRNRIRRRIFELLRGQLGAKAAGFDLVVTGFEEQLATIDQKVLQDMLTELLQKADLI